MGFARTEPTPEKPINVEQSSLLVTSLTGSEHVP